MNIHFLSFISFCTDFFGNLKPFFTKQKGKKVEKKVENCEKVSRPGLYKRISFVQKQTNMKKCANLLLILFLFTICYCFETDQMRSNVTKQGQMRKSFADVNLRQTKKKS